MPATINISYRRLPYQRHFDESTKFYDLLLAGYGAGKTFSLVMKLLKLSAINQGMPGGLLAPTYKMFKRDVLPTFKEIGFEFGIPLKWNAQDSILQLPATGTELYVFHGEDDGLSIRGPNLAFGGINEATLISQAAFNAFMARIRLKRANLMQIPMSGTPEGFNWVYDMFVAENREDADVFYGDMRLNHFVADSYAQNLMNTYDDLLAQQYVEGKFVNLARGSALYKFNRTVHTGEVQRQKDLPVWISMDFNVIPMAATIWNRYPDSERVKLKAFDEICIHGADTYLLADTIWEKIGRKTKGVVLFPDPAGDHRHTTSKGNVTDIEILEMKGFKDIRYKTRIASVRDSLNASNSFVGKNQILLDKRHCKQTIMDFEQCTIKPGTQVLDKSNLNRTHWLDGFKNMVEYEFPINAKRGSWRRQAIR